MTITVRSITPADYVATIEVIKSSNRARLKGLYPDEVIESFSKNYTVERFTKKAQEIDYFVAEDSEHNRIVGVIGLGEGRVRTFFVHPDYQRQGIGRQLYSRVESEAKRKGLSELRVESSKYAEPIYERFGFKTIEILNKEKNGSHYQEALMRKVFSKD